MSELEKKMVVAHSLAWSHVAAIIERLDDTQSPDSANWSTLSDLQRLAEQLRQIAEGE